ncbi:monovalent cation:H+ antiporter, CPA1 (nhx1) [Coemansia brasiliensis]|uniref:Sodium/hydrogen exchanger n=1 Tax=Coemansia brasiliensis TaxID=2650707 RepID=A0A9W8IE52_9FUNG|nr:monovalent cation:H+ antiporter, CPA1 (nhx1) [Coemansia brasiliensis]
MNEAIATSVEAGLSAVATALMVATPVETPVEDEPPPEDEERVSSQALLILVTLLIAALLTSYYLQRWRIRTVHETVLSIFAGMAVGLVLRFSTGSYIKRIVTFDHTVFFNMLLPPIILNCGFNLQRTSVARNATAVLTFAFVGTVISAVVIGLIVQAYSLTGIESIGFSLLDSLLMGTILSATDPVTILAVFEQLRVDPKLFSIIFGETVFNDAVAIVLFATLSTLRTAGREFTLSAVPGMAASFIGVFSASLALGVALGVGLALLCKHLQLYNYPSIEAALALLVPYQAYLLSNSLELSGIVSLLFCAATMRQYAYRSLSVRSKRTTRYLFHLLSGLAENFVFIYLGISLFTSTETVFRPVFVIYVTVATCISRYAAIFPLSRLLNAIFKYRHPSAPSSAQPVTHEEQTMLFWAGLRGAVAVALASEVSGTSGALLRTTVLCVVVLSVAIFGGTTPQVVHLLGIRTGVPQPDSSDDDNDSDSDDRRAIIDLSTGPQSRVLTDDTPPPLSRFSSPWSETNESWISRIKISFNSLDRSLIYDIDKYYIQPMLTRKRHPSSVAGNRPYRRHRSNHSRRSSSGDSLEADQTDEYNSHNAHAGSSLGATVRATNATWNSYSPSEDDPNWESDLGNSKGRNEHPLLGSR